MSFDGSAGPPGGPPALTVVASRSARASRPSPVPRSSLGRSLGRTQTSGSIPARPATASRSRATPPSVRSSTVTSPPAASRGAASMVSIADQPESVPPATSSRSIPAGSDTAYQFSCRSKASRRDCHSRNSRACVSCQLASLRCCAARITSTRCRSASTRAERSRWPARTARPLRAARTRQAIPPSPASGAFSAPSHQSASSRASSTTAAAQAAFSGRLSRSCSRRWAASQPGLSCSASGGTGRRGCGPGSGCSSPYCQPTYTRSPRTWVPSAAGPPPAAGPAAGDRRVVARRRPAGPAVMPATRECGRPRPGTRAGSVAQDPSRPA